MSAPGQTVGVSVFNDFLLDAHQLSRKSLSLAYCLGTLGSALLISRAGRLYDRFGGRWMTTLSSVMLAAVLFELSYSPMIARGCQLLLPSVPPQQVTFVVMIVSFFALRFFGQGMLTLSARNMVMEWFEQRRGMAMAVVGISVAFGFSGTPPFFEMLINWGGWQWAWRIVAVVVFGFAILTALFSRARPEDHGLAPDGPLGKSQRKTHPEAQAGRAFTLAEARRTYSFWLFALGAIMSGLVLTAFTFHVVSLFGKAGISRPEAVSIFIPAAFISVVFEFVGSWLSDFIKLKYLLMIQVAGIAILSFCLSFLQPGWPVYGAVLGMGMMQGMFGIVSGVAWPRFFGRTHLGAISGFATSLIVCGTAIGPYIFSAVEEQTGSYQPATLACGILAVLLLMASFRANRPA